MLSPTTANQLIVNKYCWMARKLRLFNDSSSIIHWCNAMSSLKNPLPQDLERYSTISTNPNNRSRSIHHNVYSVSKPTALSFLSATKPQCILTPSSTPPLHFPPQEPSPLTIHHPRRLSIHPVQTRNDLKIPVAKKRKTILPPHVDYTSPTPPKTPTPIPTIYSHTPHKARYITNPMTTREAKAHGSSYVPHMDEAYEREFALLKRDAATAGISWDIFLDRNQSKYPRCSYYFCGR